ncbi:DMT family transporter [Sulfurimonas sp.]|nr:DMT family transporter [Sulfurimonas sp.]
MTKEREGELLMVGLSIMESWFPILSIFALAYISPMHLYAYSLFISLIFFLIIMYKKNLFVELKNRDAYKDLLLTTFWITTLFSLVFIGLQFTTATNMSVILFLQLFFAYLYFNVFGKEKMDTLHTIGAFVMAVGAVTILLPEELKLNKGDLLILIVAIIAPIANMYSKRARKFCSSETILGFRTIVALPVISFLAYIFEDTSSYDDFLNALPYIGMIGFLIFGVSKILWMEALHRISVTKVSALIALVPPMTISFAYFYLNEVPSSQQIVGILTILVGGYMLTKEIKST